MTLTLEQKEDLRTQLNRILGITIPDMQLDEISTKIVVITKGMMTEQLFPCSACGKTIIAYGIHGTAFTIEHNPSGNKYFHNDLSICLA